MKVIPKTVQTTEDYEPVLHRFYIGGTATVQFRLPKNTRVSIFNRPDPAGAFTFELSYSSEQDAREAIKNLRGFPGVNVIDRIRKVNLRMP